LPKITANWVKVKPSKTESQFFVAGLTISLYYNPLYKFCLTFLEPFHLAGAGFHNGIQCVIVKPCDHPTFFKELNRTPPILCGSITDSFIRIQSR